MDLPYQPNSGYNFHMWDTACSDFKVTKTPFGRDYLKEIADACHAVHMPFGIYYSQRDWYLCI
jgi:alpha-L-fucosidase